MGYDQITLAKKTTKLLNLYSKEFLQKIRQTSLKISTSQT